MSPIPNKREKTSRYITINDSIKNQLISVLILLFVKRLQCLRYFQGISGIFSNFRENIRVLYGLRSAFDGSAYLRYLIGTEFAFLADDLGFADREILRDYKVALLKET